MKKLSEIEHKSWDLACVWELGLNMCTRGSRGLAPGQLWPMLKERLSASEHPAVGAGLKLMTGLGGTDKDSESPWAGLFTSSWEPFKRNMVSGNATELTKWYSHLQQELPVCWPPLQAAVQIWHVVDMTTLKLHVRYPCWTWCKSRCTSLWISRVL